jgi:hypothetical protein
VHTIEYNYNYNSNSNSPFGKSVCVLRTHASTCAPSSSQIGVSTFIPAAADGTGTVVTVEVDVTGAVTATATAAVAAVAAAVAAVADMMIDVVALLYRVPPSMYW